MIERNHYLDQLIAARENGFPKVITGLRRCGKSYLLKEIYRNYLIEDGVSPDQIFIVDLDDDKNILYRDPIELGKYVRDYCKDPVMHYVILDEIQMVFSLINPSLTDGKHVLARKSDKEIISFIDVVLGLSREKNIDLYVTGSNSKMLSTDIITTFRDKATNIHLAPLSFEEFYVYTGGSATDAIYDYMRYGGMPLSVLSDESNKQTYLSGLFDTTYFKDIIEHNNLKKSESLDELCNIISSSTGSLLNTEKISNTYQSVKKEIIDRSTVEKYIEYFKDSFLIREAKRYDIKGRAEIGALRKYYFSDTGLRNARLNFAYPDEGQLLENIVYNELIYKGYTVNVGTFDSVEKNKNGKSIRKTHEVDFYAVRGNDRYYIQVAADVSSISTLQREIHPYVLLHDEIKKIVVINRPVSESLDEHGFTLIGVAAFLLEYI